MATLALEETNGARPAGPAAPMTAWQVWGLILIAPYLLVFLVFVLYPVAYGFWLARDPQTYVRLFDDPIFPRSVVNTLAFAIVHPALGGAVDPHHPVVPVHAQSRVGHHQQRDLQAHRRRRTQLAQRSDAGALARRHGPHLEIAAVLDPDPHRRAPGDSRRNLRSGGGRRRGQVAVVPLHHLAVDADAVSDLHHHLDDLDAG